MSIQPPAVVPQYRWLETVTVVATIAVLLLMVQLDLVAALFAALLVYELVEVLAARVRVGALRGDIGKWFVVAGLATLIVAGLTAAVIGGISWLRQGGDGLPVLLRKLAEIIDGSRAMLPPWLVAYLPNDAEDLRRAAVAWLRENAGTLRVAGGQVGRVVAYILIGMVIGALLSLHVAAKDNGRRPLSDALWRRAATLAHAFRRVVFAQFWIALINACLTGLYLAVVLPLFDVELPLIKSMIAVTFVAGLIPILGNLISNTVIVVVSLSHSLIVAAASLLFLVVIHKLEYFLNARIIGSHIQARAWELLIVMLVMEAAFGIAGLIAAPVLYAYVKNELAQRGLL